MNNIIMTRSLKGNPDSRVEKELFSISKENKIEFFGWNRYENKSEITNELVDAYGKKIRFYHYNRIAPIGFGFKKLLIPLLRFWMAEYDFLKKKREDYSIIHACDFDTVIPAFLISKKYNKKLVYDIFDYYADSHNAPEFIKSLIKKIDDYIINKSDATIICSEKRKEQIRKTNPKNLVIIHNSPIQSNNDDALVKKNTTKKIEKIALAYIGLLSDDRYLKEISNVIIKRQDLVWYVGGWGPLEKEFVDLSRKYNNIIYYGMVPYSKAIEIEKKSDILTALYNPSVPNHKYAAPNKFYESLMLGKPVIMIKNTGMDNYVDKYSIGKVIDLEKNDFETGFENSINELLNEKRWREIEKKSKEIYSKEFSWSRMEERLLNMYRQI